MSKPIILLDSDEVFFPFGEVIINELRQTLPDLTVPILKHWYLEDNFQCPKIKKQIGEIFSRSGFFATEMIVDGALEAINNMRDYGYKVYVCTSPMIQNHWSMKDKYTWWAKYFGHEFATKNLIICPDKTMITADILIDDNPRIITGNYVPLWEQIVYNRPYNEDLKELEGLRRISWVDCDYMNIILKAIYKRQTRQLEKESSKYQKITI